MTKFGRITGVIMALVLTISMLLTFSACDLSFTNKNNDNSAADDPQENNNSSFVDKNDSKDIDDPRENSDSSVVATNAETIGDLKLVGDWSCVSLDNKGDYTGGIAFGYDANLYVMYNGQCYGSLIESLYNLEDDGDWLNPIATVDVSSGEFTFQDVSLNGDATMELKATYTFDDIAKSSVSERDEITMFHRDAKDDQLTIHFTGSLKEGPTDVKKIDFTAVYEKEGMASSENEGILWAAMVGEWNDNYGNKWTFMPRKEVKDLGFTMTADGKEYKGQSDEYVCIRIGTYEEDNKIVHKMSFNFADENMNDISQAKIISFNGKELSLEQSDGQTLTFKK